MNIFWKGSIPIKKVQWRLDKEWIILADSLEEQREQIWNDVRSKHPTSYDGDLLALKDFIVTNDEMILHMNIIKFSRILTLEKRGEHLQPYGTIGMQMIVLSPDRRCLLVGQRASNLLYCPDFYSGPGGMLEVDDAEGSFEDACIREFNEEVELEISNHLNVHAIMSEINGTVGVVFLLSTIAKENPDTESSVKGNEEWQENQLFWHSVEDLEIFNHANSLESVLFIKEDRARFERNELSIFWENRY